MISVSSIPQFMKQCMGAYAWVAELTFASFPADSTLPQNTAATVFFHPSDRILSRGRNRVSFRAQASVHKYARVRVAAINMRER